MRRHLFVVLIIMASIVPFVIFSAPKEEGKAKSKIMLEEIASSKRQWTGVAVSKRGRIFVNYPLWSGESIPFSVAEIAKDGKAKPYPDESWNTWNPTMSSATLHFICVQSVVIDNKDNLWVLDSANPRFQGVVPFAAKLLKIDLKTNKIVQKIYFDKDVVLENSYLNDVRIDTKRDYAYITDSGMGAIVVVDLKTGKSRRLLSGHSSTKSEDIVLSFNGVKWLRPDGSKPKVNADGIALSPDGEYLYYQALTGRNLYRIKTSYLRDPEYSDKMLGEAVESIGKTGAADGIMFGCNGKLYLSAIEDFAVKTFDPDTGKVETVIQNPCISWPDSFSKGPGGYIYFTTSRIYEGSNPRDEYKIYRFR